ncbi:DoxX family membrane protein [Sediminicola luteus]|nr:DoxX family membrane protein [Sediminicola luteus]
MTKPRRLSLFFLRVAIGWHFAFEALSKIENPDWTAYYYLQASQGPFSGAFHALADSALMPLVDLLNQWGMLAIGLGLILGWFTRIWAYAGMALVFLYFLATPSWPGLEYPAAFEGNYLLVNKNLIECLALWVLALFPSGAPYGLDALFQNKKTAES